MSETAAAVMELAQPAATVLEELCRAATQHKPITHQGDLAKLPRALAPLIERPQWAVWRWTQKPMAVAEAAVQATQPERHASTSDPSTWADYATALAAVQAGHADGISYILTENDPFAAIDLDHCRCIDYHIRSTSGRRITSTSAATVIRR